MSSFSKKGFTLIEILVVIAIVGLLSSIVMGSLNGSRTRSRDTFRIRELKEIEIALELYRQKHGQYPVSLGVNAGWKNDCDAGVVFVVPELVTENLFSGVKDLSPCPTHWGFSYGSNGADYKLISHSEWSIPQLQKFVDPADDGGPNPCILDGSNLQHFGVWTEGATCWREARAIPLP